MEQGIILSALLAKTPVGALADGKKLHRGTAECPRSSVSVVAPPIVGICGATNTSKATPHRAFEFGTRINGAPSTRMRSWTWTHLTGRFTTASKMGR